MNPPDATLDAPPGRSAPTGRAFAALWSLVWRTRLSPGRLPRLLAVHLLLPALALLTVKSGGTEPYLQIVLRLQLMIAMPLLCLINMAAPVRDEAEEGTLAYLSVRPLNRGVFFLILHGAHLSWLQLNFLLSGLLLLATGFWLGLPGMAGLILPFLAAQATGILAFSGLSALIGLLTRRYLIVGLLYGAIIEIGIGGIPTNINVLSVGHHVRVVVSSFAPAAELLQANLGHTALSIAVLLLVGAITAGAAALLYAIREIPIGPES